MRVNFIENFPSINRSISQKVSIKSSSTAAIGKEKDNFKDILTCCSGYTGNSETYATKRRSNLLTEKRVKNITIAITKIKKTTEALPVKHRKTTAAPCRTRAMTMDVFFPTVNAPRFIV